MGFAEPILMLIALVLVGAMARAYYASRDPLHPMIFVGPMMLYIYVFRPGVLLWTGEMQHYFSDAQATLAMAIKLASCSMFCLGCLYKVTSGAPRRRKGMEVVLTQQGRTNVYLLGCLLGTTAFGANLYMLSISGGFFRVYSHSYGTLDAPSNYFATLLSLSWPAVVFLAIARQRQRLRFQDVFLLALFLGPLLIQGILGGRRGPVFYTLATLFCCWYIFSDRRPRLWHVLTTVSVLGVLMLALVTYRNQIYIGSNLNLNADVLAEEIFTPKAVGPGDEVIVSTGLILTVAECGHVNWGWQWLVTCFVRPIPREWWPTKYEDTAIWESGNSAGIFFYSSSEWMKSVGFIPPIGSAVGFDATMFQDFSWAGLIACYFFGKLFGYVWYKEQHEKGFWQLLFVILLAVSVYVPTQGAVDVITRLMTAAIPTGVLWWFFVSSHVVPQRLERYLPVSHE